MMTWFEKLTGFKETTPQQVRERIAADGETLRVNGKTLRCGRLETPSLADLRRRLGAQSAGSDAVTVREVVGDVQALHLDGANAGALFQVASQFNLLEMASPQVTPEQGVGGYEHDHTQGPACAIAAGAGTIYRNYFAPVNGRTGQSATNQIDCLADLGAAWGNDDNRLWAMKNGYALATRSGLEEISRRLRAASEAERDEWRGLLRIGMQWNTEVTLHEAGHTVSQAYCAALPIGYSPHPAALWADFARLILEAAYEATICAAILNARDTGNNNVFLTLLGGGVFGNDTAWIMGGLERALTRYRNAALDVAVVSYGVSQRPVQQLVVHFNPSGHGPLNSDAARSFGC
jgi:hypothetical protein